MKFFFLLFSLFATGFFLGCSGSDRFTKKETEVKKEKILVPNEESFSNKVRLLIEEGINKKEILIGSKCFLFDEDKKIEIINAGETLEFSSSNQILSLNYNNNFYSSEVFRLLPIDSTEFIICNEIILRGELKIIGKSDSIMIINSLDLESYIKGIIPREMPLGKGKENYEALKAFAICARTYSLQQLNSKKYFDLYIDVRDQVYGGVDSEKPISNQVTDETKNLILTYEGNPAKVFYHSTCGGKTEDVKNIFGI
ncbi:MAG TPA: SpoIID/LytB domain-containing protein, partial [Ignavibacteriaceae bacterium]|nr:SpoIID/LytB domain-containing protein [Ignavibacteriaceae bacterium]